MSQQHDFFLARATECRAAAEASTLANVRERNLRAAVAWEAMAARALRGEQAREKLAAEKAALAEAPPTCA